ncbi:hypothetical protein HispidOSU_028186, partial [Sigmodon hispidus]
MKWAFDPEPMTITTAGLTARQHVRFSPFLRLQIKEPQDSMAPSRAAGLTQTHFST